MGSNKLRHGDRVRYDRNDKSKEGTVTLIEGEFATVEYDSDENSPKIPNIHSIESLGIILEHGVSRNEEEHELVMSGLNEAMEKLRNIGPQIDRAILAGQAGRAHSLMTAFGFVIPKTIRDIISTALFASTFADTLKDHKQVDVKTRVAISIVIEAVRLLARAFEVK